MAVDAMLNLLRLFVYAMALALLTSCGGGDGSVVAADPSPTHPGGSGDNLNPGTGPLPPAQGADYMNGWRVKTESFFPTNRPTREYTYVYGDGFVDVTVSSDANDEITLRYRTTNGMTREIGLVDGEETATFRTWHYDDEGRINRVTYSQMNTIETFVHNDGLLTSRSLVDPERTETIVYDYALGAFRGAQTFEDGAEAAEPLVEFEMTGDAGQVTHVRRLRPNKTDVTFTRHGVFYDDAGNPERLFGTSGDDAIVSSTYRIFERAEQPTLNLPLLKTKLYPDHYRTDPGPLSDLR